MVNNAKAVLVIQDFTGLLTNTGPSGGDNPPGSASVQTNAMNVRVGELTSRPGYKIVQFEDE